MAITLNHTIVPCFDKQASAALYCRLFGFKYLGEFSRFSVVRVNDASILTAGKNLNPITMHLRFPSRNLMKYSSACKRRSSNMAAVPVKRRT